MDILWVLEGSIMQIYIIQFPVEIEDTCDLMLLADEYLIADLKQKCEEDIISKLNSNNIL